MLPNMFSYRITIGENIILNACNEERIKNQINNMESISINMSAFQD